MSVTAALLENQRLMNENPTSTADIAMFKRISIPLIRRIYPQLIANSIVNVQPLMGPALPYIEPINNDGWGIKKKKKKIWRDITDPWEASDVG